MKFLLILGLILLYGLSSVVMGGFITGYRNSHFTTYTFSCAYVCPQDGFWYTKYYGIDSADQCASIGGEPKMRAIMALDDNGVVSPTGAQEYVGCEAI